MKRMASIVVLMVVALLMPMADVAAQPFLDVYLQSLQPASRGNRFSVIEEEQELHITGKKLNVRQTYNAHGQILYELGKNSRGGRNSETKWEYSSTGKLLKRSGERYVNVVGWTTEVVEFHYSDSSGHLEAIVHTVGDGFSQRADVRCDSTGMPMEAKVYNTKGALINIERVMIIPASNCIRVTRHTPSGLFSGSYNYPIDPKEPVPTNNLKREFNEYGDVVLEALEGKLKLNQAYYYEYEYDSQGNWITRHTYSCSIAQGNKPRNKKLEYTVTRKITY